MVIFDLNLSGTLSNGHMTFNCECQFGLLHFKLGERGKLINLILNISLPLLSVVCYIFRRIYHLWMPAESLNDPFPTDIQNYCTNLNGQHI